MDFQSPPQGSIDHVRFEKSRKDPQFPLLSSKTTKLPGIFELTTPELEEKAPIFSSVVAELPSETQHFSDITSDAPTEPAQALPEVAGVKVLNLGLFRTGTTSLCVALQELGYGSIYHMDTVFSKRQEDSKVWIKAFDSKYGSSRRSFPIEEIKGLFTDFDAVTDLPASAFSEELVQAFPHAKVILTVRDSPEVWQAAVERTVWHVHVTSFFRFTGIARVLADPFLPSLFRMGRRMFYYLFGDNLPEHGLDVYNDHITKIKALVPADNLLVFNVKEGWDPLCKFLGRKVPDHKFPHVNDGASFVEKVKSKQKLMKARMRRDLLKMAGTVALGLSSIALARYVAFRI